MKTLVTIGKFVLPVVFVLVMGYFFLPGTNRSSAQPQVKKEVTKPQLKQTAEQSLHKESADVPVKRNIPFQKEKATMISERQTEDTVKSDDPFANISSALELGQMLFWDPILSGNKDVACATCHHPDFAYADSRDLSIGTLGVGLGPDRIQTAVPPVKRNAHTIVNTAFNGLNNGRGRGRGRNDDDLSSNNSTPVFQNVNQTRAPMFWDSRVRSLELQALEPIKAYDEMRGDAFTKDDALDSVVARIKDISDYIKLFKKVYGEEVTINASLIGSSIAEFERSLVAVNSPFDKYMAGDKEALSPEQVRGLETFRDVGCDNCHRGAMFSDFQLHALGVKENAQLDTADNGAGRFRFRTPSLRNVALTAPYMHNGTFKTLEEVIQFYNNGRSENPNVVAGGDGRGRGGNRGFFDGDGRGQAQGGNNNNQATLDNQFRRIDDMNASEMSDIISFLKALTDENFDHTIPTVVPSGLPPGGIIKTQL